MNAVRWAPSADSSRVRIISLSEDIALLRRAARALHRAESVEQWTHIVADAGSGFAAQFALFAVEGGELKLRSWRGFPTVFETPVAIPLHDAPAFQHACDSREPVVSMFTPTELSARWIDLVRDSGHERVHIIPVVGPDRVPAVFYVTGEPDLEALEVLAALAAGSLVLRRTTVAPFIFPVSPAGD